MSHEAFHGNESSGKEPVIAALRENPENLAPLHEWLAAKEAACHNGMDNLRLTLELLDIYIEAGSMLSDAAWDTLEAAYEQAEGEGSDEILAELDLRAAKLRAA